MSFLPIRHDISSPGRVLRRPSRNELIFAASLALVFSITGIFSIFAPFDWLQKQVTAQINERAYDGDGVVVSIDEKTFEALGRDEWSRSDLALLVDAISEASPDDLVVDTQNFANGDQSGVDALSEALRGFPSDVYWKINLPPEDIERSRSWDATERSLNYSTASLAMDPAAQGIAQPVATIHASFPIPAPLVVSYAVTTKDGVAYPSAAQVLAKAERPPNNLFEVDLSYDPKTVPTYSARDVVSGLVGARELNGKKVIIAFDVTSARDTIATPHDPYTPRAAVYLIAAETLKAGPPMQIGWWPALIVALAGGACWVFVRRPWGRLGALMSLLVLLFSPIWLEQSLIFQSTSQGVFLLVVLALGKLWMRVRKSVTTYRDAAESKSRFLAQASHDLRQPIHAIGLLSERLAQTDLSQEQRAMVSKISWSVDNASRMFRTLLDIAAIESGALKPNLAAVAINDLLAEIDSQNSLAAEQANVDLRLVPSDRVVLTDRVLIGTMLQNLVSNAIKYSSGKSVVVGCRLKGGKVALCVVDSGRGIARSELRNVQKEFYRLSRRSSLQSDNKGLGLAIVNRLALLLKLKFSLDSEEKKGTAARIDGLVPVDQTGAIGHGSNQEGLPMSGLRVALADDEPDTLESTRGLLEQWGCIVETFERFPDNLSDCDVLLTDYDFGDTGTLSEKMDALDRVRQSGIQVIVVSGHDSALIRESISGQAQLVLSKPVRPAELRSALMSVRLS